MFSGCGTCITFHPDKEEVFLVGTEEGLVHKCSKAYSRNYLSTLEAHHMPVYRIDYNKYDSNVFATCSADWKVKIWEDARLLVLVNLSVSWNLCVLDIK